MKRSLAVFLTVFLIITMCIPAFAAEKECEPPLASDFGSGSTTSESVTPSDSVKNERPTLVVTQEPIYPNWQLWATLPEVASDTVEYITPYYSFDGEAFTVGERLSYANFSGLAIEPNVEPMNSFTEGRADEFWIYLQIEGDRL